MKIRGTIVTLLTGVWAAIGADSWRVAVLDFEDQTAMRSEPALGGVADPAAIAAKGVSALGRLWANRPGFVLVDRRDLLAQMTHAATGQPRPSPIRVAQAVNADVLLRGSLQALSVGKTAVRQGGHQVDFSTVTLRVGLEAMDATDGSIIASSVGSATRQLRQTESLQTVLGEADLLTMLDEALAAAAPDIEKVLLQRRAEIAERPSVRITVRTTADPALVEIDGMLVGTTPLENFRVAKGDHVLTIGRAGYRDLRKRILIDRDLMIEVPMIRTELTAEELKDVLDKARVHAVIGEPGLTILPLQ